MTRLLRSAFVICVTSLTLNAAPQLRLSTQTVGPVYVEAGSNAPSQPVNAFNLGDGSLNLSVAYSSATWVTASIGQLTTCSNGPAPSCIPITLNLNTSGLPVGTYTESLTLADPNAIDSPQTITVTVQVNGTPTNTI